MGTPQFACPTLQKLIEDPNFDVVAVYTREPQIAGRGHKLTNSPIHELALKHGLPVLTPKTLRNAQTQQEFSSFGADAAVVVAYGLILPEEILQATKFGCVNLHPSLLPRWRGPSPIQYTLFAGDSEIGVTIIKMDAGIDSGEMVLQREFLLEKSDNYGNLVPKLEKLGAEMIVESLKLLHSGDAVLTPQSDNLATFSKKLKKEEGKIDWNLPVEVILNKIRGLSGSLTAYFEYKGEIIKIFAAEIIAENTLEGLDLEAFAVGDAVNKDFVIKCRDGFIKPLILQRQGKKPVLIAEFLLGFKV